MSREIVLIKEPQVVAGLSMQPPALFLPHAKAAEWFFDFFTSNIRNKNTRRAYYKAACRFSECCQGRGLDELSQVKFLHIAGYIEALQGGGFQTHRQATPGRNPHGCSRLVVGHVIDTNPAHAVRGPRHVVKKGRTPVLDREEAQALLATINTATRLGLRESSHLRSAANR